MSRPAPDPNEPVALAPGIWWVGAYQPAEEFQCHSYLVDTDDGAVLLDPGSVLTWPTTREKIARLMPLARVRWIVAHHPDPDVVGALRDVAADLPGPLEVLTHWRVATLLKSYGAGLPLRLVEDADWQLTLGGRTFDFVFTPYAHFPGAFCTFDRRTGTLFSSDLFGGFTEGFSLFADGEGYLDLAQPFHEHYIPSREVLLHAVAQCRRFPVERIAPQHGSIVEGATLVEYLYQRLSALDCGLFLLKDTGRDVLRLAWLHRELGRLTEAVVNSRSLGDVLRAVEEVLSRRVPVAGIEVFACFPGGRCLHFEPLSQYRGLVLSEAPAGLAAEGAGSAAPQVRSGPDGALSISLRLSPGGEGPVALLRVALAPPAPAQPPPSLASALDFLTEAREALEVATARAADHRNLDLQRAEWVERSIRDPLTGLYSRLYLHIGVERMLDQARRSQAIPLALLMLDLDHFKRVNDTFGHVEGDRVLAAVGAVISQVIRQTDIAVRLGGEEFAVFTSGNRDALTTAQRLRRAIRELRLDGPLAGQQFTVSVGVAHFQGEDQLDDLVARADARLYAAKKAGRDRIAV